MRQVFFFNLPVIYKMQLLIIYYVSFLSMPGYLTLSNTSLVMKYFPRAICLQSIQTQRLIFPGPFRHWHNVIKNQDCRELSGINWDFLIIQELNPEWLGLISVWFRVISVWFSVIQGGFSLIQCDSGWFQSYSVWVRVIQGDLRRFRVISVGFRVISRMECDFIEGKTGITLPAVCFHRGEIWNHTEIN